MKKALTCIVASTILLCGCQRILPGTKEVLDSIYRGDIKKALVKMKEKENNVMNTNYSDTSKYLKTNYFRLLSLETNQYFDSKSFYR